MARSVTHFKALVSLGAAMTGCGEVAYRLKRACGLDPRTDPVINLG